MTNYYEVDEFLASIKTEEGFKGLDDVAEYGAAYLDSEGKLTIGDSVCQLTCLYRL